MWVGPAATHGRLLPVHAPDQLDDASSVTILDPVVVRIRSQTGDRLEPGMVERVQELGPELEVEPAFDRDPLDRAEIEPHQFRPGHDYIVQPAIAVVRRHLDAVRTVGGLDIAAGWRLAAVAGGGRCADAVG